MRRMGLGRFAECVALVTVLSIGVSWAQGKAAAEKKPASAKQFAAVLVTYENDTPYDQTINGAKEWAKGLKKVPGLISKTWLNDGKTAGGFYTFTDRASAEAFINGDMFQSAVPKDPANRNVQIKYFAVNAELCSVTNCPMKPMGGK
jgi:hypothetical protein